MCTFNAWKSTACPHRWMTLDTPCASGNDLLSCTRFSDGALNQARHSRLKFQKAPASSCPRCSGAEYDMRYVRAIESVAQGAKLGRPVGKKTDGSPGEKTVSRMNGTQASLLEAVCCMM